MTAPRTISFRISADKVAALDTIAKAMDRDRSYLLNEAVETYLNEQQRFVALVNEGIRAAEKGDLIDDDQVRAMVDSWGAKEQPEKRAKG